MATSSTCAPKPPRTCQEDNQHTQKAKDQFHSPSVHPNHSHTTNLAAKHATAHSPTTCACDPSHSYPSSTTPSTSSSRDPAVRDYGCEIEHHRCPSVSRGLDCSSARAPAPCRDSSSCCCWRRRRRSSCAPSLRHFWISPSLAPCPCPWILIATSRRLRCCLCLVLVALSHSSRPLTRRARRERATMSSMERSSMWSCDLGLGRAPDHGRHPVMRKRWTCDSAQRRKRGLCV